MTLTDLYNKYGIKKPPCGSSIGKGWLLIVDEAFKTMIEVGWDKDLQQIKSKFCSLVIYIGKESPEVMKAIKDATIKANNSCEYCGNPHNLTVPMCGNALCSKCKDIYPRDFWSV